MVKKWLRGERQGGSASPRHLRMCPHYIKTGAQALLGITTPTPLPLLGVGVLAQRFEIHAAADLRLFTKLNIVYDISSARGFRTRTILYRVSHRLLTFPARL